MSVFGGDSWAREAHYRKRRVDNLLAQTLPDSSFKKLSNGKYVCLICPRNPTLDTPLMLSMHRKGSRHLASEAKLREKEVMKQEDLSKRLAFSASSTCETNPSVSCKKSKFNEKPLVKHVQKVASALVSGKTSSEFSKKEDLNTSDLASYNFSKPYSIPTMEALDGKLTLNHFDSRERRERELKFTAAGWKRDGHGKWYKDENVEFDSDEEDPNICLG